MVEAAKKDEDIVKAKIDLAKKAEDEAEKARLEALKNTHEARRKYIERIRKIREKERKTNEARVAYYKALRDGIDKGVQLQTERSGVQDPTQLLGLEEELIKLAKEIGDKQSKLAGESKSLNSERMNAFNERKKIMEAMTRAGN